MWKTSCPEVPKREQIIFLTYHTYQPWVNFEITLINLNFLHPLDTLYHDVVFETIVFFYKTQKKYCLYRILITGLSNLSSYHQSSGKMGIIFNRIVKPLWKSIEHRPEMKELFQASSGSHGVLYYLHKRKRKFCHPLPRLRIIKVS